METLSKPAKSKRKKLDDIEPKAAPEPTNVDMTTVLFYVGQMDAQEAVIALQRSRLKKIRKAAESAGIVLKDLDRARKMRDELSETTLDSMKRLAAYAKWMEIPIGTQLSFVDTLSSIPKTEELAERAERQGFTDGIMGKDQDWQAYPPDNEFHQRYLTGWHRAQDEFRARIQPLQMSLDNDGAEEKAKAENLDEREHEEA